MKRLKKNPLRKFFKILFLKIFSINYFINRKLTFFTNFIKLCMTETRFLYIKNGFQKFIKYYL